MSLINKMLQDLDARGTPKDGALPGQVKPVARASDGPGRGTLAAAVGAAVAVLALGGIGWKLLGHGARPAPAVVAAAQEGQGAAAVRAAAASVPAPAGAPPTPPAPAAAAPTAAPVAVTAATPPPAAAGPGSSAATLASAAVPPVTPGATPSSAAVPAPHADPMAPPAAARAAAGPAGADHDTDHDTARDAGRPPTRAERRAERERRAAERKEQEAAARRADRADRADRAVKSDAAAAVRRHDVAPMEPDSDEARAARRAMAQILADRATSPKRRSAAMLAAARAAAQEEPAPKAKHAVQGRQESGAQRAEGEYRRALASLQEGRTGDTIAALEAALRIDPAHDAARQTLVGVLIEANRADEAMRQLQQGLALDPRQPALAMLLARLQIERGGSGIETLTRTLPYAGTDPDYHAFLAAALARQGRHRDAAEQYVQAVRAAPGNGVWWMGLGISLQADKRNAEALEAFQKARASGALSQELLGFVERRIQQLGR